MNEVNKYLIFHLKVLSILSYFFHNNFLVTQQKKQREITVEKKLIKSIVTEKIINYRFNIIYILQQK